MLHECAGTGCGFCRWRQAHPIELGWEKTSVDVTVEGLLAEAEAEKKYDNAVAATLCFPVQAGPASSYFWTAVGHLP